MHFAVRAALAAEGSYPKTHTGVRGEFGRIFIKPRKLPLELADYFDEARSYREKADYAPEFGISEKASQDVLRKAEELVSAVKSYVSGNARK